MNVFLDLYYSYFSVKKIILPNVWNRYFSETFFFSRVLKETVVLLQKWISRMNFVIVLDNFLNELTKPFYLLVCKQSM